MLFLVRRAVGRKIEPACKAYSHKINLGRGGEIVVFVVQAPMPSCSREHSKVGSLSSSIVFDCCLPKACPGLHWRLQTETPISFSASLKLERANFAQHPPTRHWVHPCNKERQRLLRNLHGNAVLYLRWKYARMLGVETIGHKAVRMCVNALIDGPTPTRTSCTKEGANSSTEPKATCCPSHPPPKQRPNRVGLALPGLMPRPVYHGPGFLLVRRA